MDDLLVCIKAKNGSCTIDEVDCCHSVPHVMIPHAGCDGGSCTAFPTDSTIKCVSVIDKEEQKNLHICPDILDGKCIKTECLHSQPHNRSVTCSSDCILNETTGCIPYTPTNEKAPMNKKLIKVTLQKKNPHDTSHEISSIKFIRSVAGLGLREAKDIVDSSDFLFHANFELVVTEEQLGRMTVETFARNTICECPYVIIGAEAYSKPKTPFDLSAL